MKYILATFVFILSTSLYAGPGLGTGGIGMTTMKSELYNSDLHNLMAESDFYRNNTLLNQPRKNSKEADVIKLPQSEVEALINIDGDYARLDDIRERFVHFRGVKIKNNSVEVTLGESFSEVTEIHLESGHKLILPKENKKRN